MQNNEIFKQWNESSAYILGFWLADGCIRYKPVGRSRYYKTFIITNTEKQIMDDISSILRCHYRLKNKNRPIHNKKCYEIEIYSDDLFDFCYSIINQTKKSQSQNIILPLIPSKYINHFIRGFFDGDGSIYMTHLRNRHGKIKERLGTSFTAGLNTGDFLEKIHEIIRNYVSVGNRAIVLGPHNKKLSFCQYDSALLCEWMYKNATVYMDRKKKIWDNTDKKRLFTSKKFFSNKV